MPKRSKVYQLPEALIAEINKLLLQQRLTLKELRDYINSHKLNNDITISHGSLGRYKLKFDKAMEELQAIEHLIKSLPKDTDFNKENDLHKLVSKLLNKSLVDTLFSKKKELTPKEIADLAKAVQNLMASAQTREKIKTELEKEFKNQQSRG